MLQALLNPKTVAMIGASRVPGKVGHEILANLIQAGFKGKIVPVNPSGGSLLGLECVPDLKQYDGTIDLAVIAVPNKLVKESLENAISVGAKAAIVITAGFKEVGAEGAAKEREIAEICQSAGVRMLGPNCLGMLNTECNLNASFAAQMPATGGISVISQSGALCTAILDWAAGNEIGLAKLLSIGNKADLDETDCITYLADDDQTKVITCYLESIMNGPGFLKAAEAAARKKPVVIMKVGTSNAGGKAASSHTGSLAGADIAYDAAFRRSGVVRAENFESLFDASMAFAMQPIPKGNRVAIITNAGGPGIMAADAAEHSGLKVESLTPAIAEVLKGKLPAAASVGNPIDVLGDADAERYALAVEAAEDDDSVDAIVVILTPQAMTDAVATAEAIGKALRGNKPVLVTFMGGHTVTPGRNRLVELSIPSYPSPDRAVAALKAMCDYADWRKRPARKLASITADRAKVEAVFARHEKSGRPEIGEVESKEIFAAYGLKMLPGGLATTADEAAAIAEKAGYPVAMKISSPDILHKSDMGGVKLFLNNADEVREAFTSMMKSIAEKAPKAQLEGAFVEKMAAKGREVIIGMSRDPQFGPMVMFGLGGIFVEVLKDVTFELAPITADEAMEMMARTKSYALLKGVRGQAGVDLPAVADVIQRVSQLVTDFPQIAEMDINPLIVGPDGPIVADGRMILSGIKK